MTRLIMQVLPYSKLLGYNLTYKKCLYWIKNGFCVYNFSLRLSEQYQRHITLHSRFTRDTSKNVHLSSTQNCDPDGEIVDIENMGFHLTKTVEIEDHSEHFRNTLYPDSTDDIIIQLKECSSLKNLIDILNSKSASLTSEHYCQTILVLSDLNKLTDKNLKSLSGKLYFGGSKRNENIHITNILSRVLRYLTSDLDRLTPDALACSVLYSHRCGVSLTNPFIQLLLIRIDKLLLNEDVNEFSLSALSRLTLAFEDHDELWTKLFLIKTLPLIYQHFDRCSSSEDFRALTISMLSTLPYLREDLLIEYEALTEEFLRNGILKSNHTSIIIKAALLLSYIYHKPTARYMIYKLFHMINDDINQLFLPHLMDLQKVVLQHLEPQYTITKLNNFKKAQSVQLMSHSQFFLFNFYLVTLPKNAHSSLILKNAINEEDNLDSLLCILPNLTTAQVEICHMFWAKVVQLMSSIQPMDSKILQRICLRYMNFTSRMDSYRHKQFELYILSLITTELVEGSSGVEPQVFALLAAFVLSFDRRGHGITSLSSDIVPRLLSMMDQFSTQSCLLLSKSIKMGMLYNRNRDLHIYLQVDSALSKRTGEIIKNMDNISIKEFNVVLRSCINQKGSVENSLLWDILKMSDQLDWSYLTSRVLRNLVYNLHFTSALVPLAIDRMIEYCLQNSQYITGETVGKLMYLCYYLGYTPAHINSFCAVVADLAYRDREMIKGLSLLQLALALSYYNQLPPSLCRYIFTVHFLETLDDEIKTCFTKDKYPQRVRQELMQLNRSVCLDQPEADVPWFHSKFCEQQQALGQSENRPKLLLFTDVLSTLTSIVGSPTLVQPRALTPYGYTIDIQLNLNAALQPVPFENSKSAVHKLAILLHYGNNYTVYKHSLKGYYQMKQRHLEILGYKVIPLSDSIWNAMFMSEPKAKQEYLQKLIWPS